MLTASQNHFPRDDREPTGEYSVAPANLPPHAFDLDEFRSYLGAEFPGYSELIATAARPTISGRPDEMEQWEAERILERKSPRDYEQGQPASYLLRLLYEETFSVNQKPGDPSLETFRGSAGMTPGGLISHHYQRGSYNGKTMLEMAQQPALDQPTFGQALTFLGPKWGSGASDLLEQVHRITNPGTFMQPNLQQVTRYATGEIHPKDEYDTIGYRLLKILHNTPEMTEPVADKELQTRFVQGDSTIAISRAELFTRAWDRSQILIPDGSFTTADTPEVKQAVDNLLALRTHPEMQVFYRYLSPSGYINELYTGIGNGSSDLL